MSVREQLQDILAITEEPAVRDTLERIRTETQRILAIPESDPDYIHEISSYGFEGDHTLPRINLPYDVNRKLFVHFLNIIRMAQNIQITDRYNNP